MNSFPIFKHHIIQLSYFLNLENIKRNFVYFEIHQLQI
jgi:hypothetical protein